jgi:hypothetical protein
MHAVVVYIKGITPAFSSDDFVHLENNIHCESLAEATEVFIKPYGREYRPLAYRLEKLFIENTKPHVFKVG